MANRNKRKTTAPEKSFPAPITTPRGRRHVALLVILAGLTVSHIYHSSVFQSVVDVVEDGVPSSTPWNNELPTLSR